MNYFELKLDQSLNISAHISWVIWVICAIMFLTFIMYKFYFYREKRWEINEVEIGMGSNKVKIKVNNDDRQIAYKIWVELSTRKIGIEIDPKQDVTTEVYDSWYKFFEVTRELIKNIPVSKLDRQGTKAIVKLSIDILNEDIRPHLTQWQAAFRKWYAEEIEKETSISLSPQQIQQNFPQYKELISDMCEVNANLVEYRQSMYKAAIGNENGK